MGKSSIAYGIARILCYQGLGISDIEAALKKIPPAEQFDLAVEKNERILRYPATDENILRYRDDVKGIFYSKLKREYLELDESAFKRLSKKDLKEIPTFEEWREIIGLRDSLNNLIERLEGSKIEGLYHATIGLLGATNYSLTYIMDGVTAEVKHCTINGYQKPFAKVRRLIKL